MDHLSKEKRAWNMAQIKSKNTSPEIIIRKYLHNRGFRFRINVKKLYGSPDVVLEKYKTAIFVHGCFWHRHLSCKRCSSPKSNIEYWQKKFTDNINRDRNVVKELNSMGYEVFVIWECQVNDEKILQNVINNFKKNKKHD
jgi:DNA mismatch endonuclease (patch repair protein)